MIIDDFSEMAALLFAISLASERIVTASKSIAPIWLADEKKTDAQETDLVADKWRRVLVQLISFLASWATAALVSDETGLNSFIGHIKFGSSTHGLPVVVVGLLASGGSSLWSNVLGYSKAIKDIRSQQKAKESLNYHETAKKLGLTTYDTGSAIRQKVSDDIINTLSTLTNPDFNNPINNVNGTETSRI